MTAFRRFTYVTAHSPTLPSLYLRRSSFSNPSVASPTSQYVLQPFFRRSYLTGFSLTSPGEPPMLHCFRNFFHERNRPWIETDGNLNARDKGCMLSVVAVRLLPIPDFFMVVRATRGLTLSCCKRLLFRLTMMSISVSKFHKLVPVVVNKDPHRLRVRLE